MRTHAIALICLGFVGAIAACEKGIIVMGRGHEDIGMPAMADAGPPAERQAVRPDKPKSEPASRQAEPSAARPTDTGPSCLTSDEAVRSIAKTVPDAAVIHLDGPQAADFIARFRSERGADVAGDEVMVVGSSSYAAARVVVFVRKGCTVRTLAYQPTMPNHDQ